MYELNKRRLIMFIGVPDEIKFYFDETFFHLLTIIEHIFIHWACLMIIFCYLMNINLTVWYVSVHRTVPFWSNMQSPFETDRIGTVRFSTKIIKSVLFFEPFRSVFVPRTLTSEPFTCQRYFERTIESVPNR